jgi:hypothetical protein
LLGNKAFVWVGTRSYGLYLYHWPVYQIIRKQAGLSLTIAELVLAMLITVPLTEASYRFVEAPIRKHGFAATMGKLKRPSMNMVAAGAVGLTLTLSAYSLMKADPQCVGEQSCANAASAADDTTTTAAVPDTTAVGGSTVDTVATTTTVPKVPQAYVAIGESVMVGAEPLLEGAGVFVQAREGRGPEGVKNAVIQLRDAGDLGQGSTIVIQVGTNAPLRQAELDDIMTEMPAGVTGVVFMTLQAPDIAYIADNNALLQGMATLYPNVRIIDWDTASEQVELCSDGIHISCNGSAPAKFYANLILGEFGLPALT